MDRSRARRASRVASGWVIAAAALAVAAPCAAADALYADGFETLRPVPMALISRGQPTAASAGDAASVVVGEYFGGATWDVVPGAPAPAWIAIRVGAGPTRAMLSWVAYPGSVVPARYRIETSADSTDGADGSWSIAATISGNTAPARAHSFAFGGAQWVRFVVIDAAVAGQPISIDEVDVHDASAGTSDSWMFVGDSITAAAFNRSLHEGDFAERIHAVAPGYFPLMIGAGVGGTSTVDGVEHIDEWIALHAEIQNWVISYGTNDSATADPQYAPDFGARLRIIVTRLQAAGKTVYVPRIPYKTGGEAYLGAYNAQVDAVRAELGLRATPDLYAWFIAHPEQLADGVHPNDAGARAMNQLWADAVRGLYPP
jgi:lysophospholipase L1-like esterase